MVWNVSVLKKSKDYVYWLDTPSVFRHTIFHNGIDRSMQNLYVEVKYLLLNNSSISTNIISNQGDGSYGFIVIKNKFQNTTDDFFIFGSMKISNEIIADTSEMLTEGVFITSKRVGSAPGFPYPDNIKLNEPKSLSNSTKDNII